MHVSVRARRPPCGGRAVRRFLQARAAEEEPWEDWSKILETGYGCHFRVAVLAPDPSNFLFGPR
eukprot:8785798-Alexandrium_andersonii.AAC.1